MPDSHGKPTVIVTGNDGLLGSAVVRGLHDQYGVVGFDRDGSPQPPQPEVECVLMDITKKEDVELAIERVRYAYGDTIASVVHLAAYYDFSGDPSPLYQKVTIDGTRRLLDTLHAKDMNVEQFLFSSTMLIHAPTVPGEPIDEESPIQKSWPYPDSKIQTERVIHDHRVDIKAACLRIAGVYNDDGTAPTIVHQVKRIYEKKLQSHVYPAPTDRGQSFVHIDDTVDAIRRCVDRRHDLPEEVSILIGEPETYSYGELQDAIGEAMWGHDWRTFRVPATVAKVGASLQEAAAMLPGVDEPFIQPWMVDHAGDHFELDISRARRLLGWEPEHRLIREIPRIVETLKRDPAAWFERNGLDPVG